MAKVRTLSRKFMKGQPLESIPTFFVEYFLNSLKVDYRNQSYLDKLFNLNLKSIDLRKLTMYDIANFHNSLLQATNFTKKHTIRGGNHFKVGDNISLRVWLNKPYNSPQVILWDDLKVKKVYDFSKDLLSDNFTLNGKELRFNEVLKIANNDGLELSAFNQWFNKPFNGQLISWVDDINY